MSMWPLHDQCTRIHAIIWDIETNSAQKKYVLFDRLSFFKEKRRIIHHMVLARGLHN